MSPSSDHDPLIRRNPEPSRYLTRRLWGGIRPAFHLSTKCAATSPSRNLHFGFNGWLLTIYLIADIGSIGGGWISSHLLKRGWTPNRARKLAILNWTILICALCVTPIVFAASGLSRWNAILPISLAAAAHQVCSANIFTLASDMFPRKAVGSVVGIGGMAGAVGGMFVALWSGRCCRQPIVTSQSSLLPDRLTCLRWELFACSCRILIPLTYVDRECLERPSDKWCRIAITHRDCGCRCAGVTL